MPAQVARLEGKAFLAERDITVAAANLREHEHRMAEHITTLGVAIGQLQQQIVELTTLLRGVV